MQKVRKWIILLLLCSLTAGCGKESSLSASWEEQTEQDTALAEQTEKETASGEQTTQETVAGQAQSGESAEGIYVQILGAVKNPGVYEVPEGSRLFQVLEQAGGFTKNACVKSVNQAEVVTDEQQIYVYTEDEMEQLQSGEGTLPASETGTASQEGKVNLNTAGKEQLMTLPGIGEAKANSIIEYREKVGKFSSIEDIMKVEGIKEGVYNKIKEQITV